MVDKNFEILTYSKPLESVVRSDAEEALGTVLSLVNSSHSAVFIFDKENNFKGLVSPYSILYQHNYPYETKVGSIVFNPPHITKNTPLYEVAKHMVSTRMYSLPIFDEDHKICGVVHGKDILQGIAEDTKALTYLSSTVKPRTPITANINSDVEEVYQHMKEKGVSRIVLVDDEGNMTGIISRSDLLPVFMKPTPKQRFGKNGVRSTDWAFDTEKKYRKNEPVRTFLTEMVEKAGVGASRKEIIKKLIASDHNSIVIVDKGNKPVGFVSLRDMFISLALLYPEEDTPIIFEKPSNSVSKEEIQKVEEHLSVFMKKMRKRTALTKVQVSIEEPKYPTGLTAVFNTTLVVTPVVGRDFVSKTKRNTWIEGVQAATDQIYKQEGRRRGGKTREETLYASI